MKRFLIFLFLAPISGSLVTMLFDVQMNLLLPGPARLGIKSFGISFFFGYLAGIVPALILAVTDWALARNAMRVGIVAGIAFAVACLCTFRVFDLAFDSCCGVFGGNPNRVVLVVIGKPVGSLIHTRRKRMPGVMEYVEAKIHFPYPGPKPRKLHPKVA